MLAWSTVKLSSRNKPGPLTRKAHTGRYVDGYCTAVREMNGQEAFPVLPGPPAPAPPAPAPPAPAIALVGNFQRSAIHFFKPAVTAEQKAALQQEREQQQSSLYPGNKV